MNDFEWLENYGTELNDAWSELDEYEDEVWYE